MENTMNYDEYDAYIHGCDYHTGTPIEYDLREKETAWTNPLNSITFIMNMKEKK
jgi:hypothetical protein